MPFSRSDIHRYFDHRCIDRYLEPLAADPAIAPHLRFGHRVSKVTHAGADKLLSQGRRELPFELLIETRSGRTRLRARAVIDASVTWTRPNPLGADGLTVDGEVDASDRIRHRIPDARGRDRGRYAGRSTVVVGSGHSAFSALRAHRPGGPGSGHGGHLGDQTAPFSDAPGRGQ